jgi:transketolase
MRNEFAQAIIDNFPKTENQVFFTGDLGFMALEKVQTTFGDRFINAGVAEQNMVTMAAALAKEGFTTWAYSIAPFVTLRPYEQIRNDVCLHNLPVKLVGNGGGFGYGIMGATHHNPEDIGAMRLLPNMQIFVPFLASDVAEAVEQILANPHPNYLRLNVGAKINYSLSPFATWRKIKDGNKAVVIGTGPVLANIFQFENLMEDVEVWVVSKFPFGKIPTELMQTINTTKKLLTIEEHLAAGGLGEMIAVECINQLTSTIQFKSLHIQGYLSGKYGSQQWHLEENSLAGTNLQNQLQAFLK